MRQEFDPSMFQRETRFAKPIPDLRIRSDVFSDSWKPLLSSTENTAFSTVSNLFPKLDGKNLDDWMSELTKKGPVRFLEYGNMNDQATRTNVLGKYEPRISIYSRYIALQPRDEPLSPSYTGDAYEDRVGYWHALNPDILGRSSFDIAIAKVGKTPNPLEVVRRLYESTAQNGLLFVNGIVVDKKIATDLMSQWENDGISFSHTFESTNSNFSRQGLAILDIAIKKTTKDIVIAQPLDEMIRTNNTFYPFVRYASVSTKEPVSA